MRVGFRGSFSGGRLNYVARPVHYAHIGCAAQVVALQQVDGPSFSAFQAAHGINEEGVTNQIVHFQNVHWLGHSHFDGIGVVMHVYHAQCVELMDELGEVGCDHGPEQDTGHTGIRTGKLVPLFGPLVAGRRM